MYKRKRKVCLEVTGAEFQMLCKCLMDWRNKLLAAGRFTDPIDEMLAKLMRC